jgi:tetratricopeptide (TPR) repeat protein
MDSRGSSYLANPYPADMFVSHFAGHGFGEDSEAIQRVVRREGRNFHLFIDVFANNQNEVGAEQDIQMRGDVIGGVQTTLLVLSPWQNPAVFARLWCLFETMLAVKQVGKSCVLKVALCETERKSLQMALCGEHPDGLLPQMLFDAVERIDGESAETGSAEDKQLIGVDVYTEGGFTVLNSTLRLALKEVVVEMLVEEAAPFMQGVSVDPREMSARLTAFCDVRAARSGSTGGSAAQMREQVGTLIQKYGGGGATPSRLNTMLRSKFGVDLTSVPPQREDTNEPYVEHAKQAIAADTFDATAGSHALMQRAAAAYGSSGRALTALTEWDCPQCTFKNESTSVVCSMCHVTRPKPGLPSQKKIVKSQPKVKQWTEPEVMADESGAKIVHGIARVLIDTHDFGLALEHAMMALAMLKAADAVKEREVAEARKVGVQGKSVDFVARLTRIYSEYNPAKLQDPDFIANTLKRYAGKEELLMGALKTKYKIPDEVLMAGGGQTAPPLDVAALERQAERGDSGYEAVVTAIYRIFAPEKLENARFVPNLLGGCTGQEKELVASLRKKFDLSEKDLAVLEASVSVGSGQGKKIKIEKKKGLKKKEPKKKVPKKVPKKLPKKALKRPKKVPKETITRSQFPTESAYFVAVLGDFYQTYCPEKLETPNFIENTLQKYTGREEELIKALRKRHNVEEDSSEEDSSGESEDLSDLSEEDSSDEEGAEEEGEAAIDYVILLTRIYLKANPEKLRDSAFVQNTLLKYKGREDALVEALEKKYKVGLEVPKEVIPQVVPAAEGVKGDDAQFADTYNIYCTRGKYANALSVLYQKYNPEKLKDPEFVTNTLQKYKGREDVLMSALKIKYGVPDRMVGLNPYLKLAESANPATHGQAPVNGQDPVNGVYVKLVTDIYTQHNPEKLRDPTFVVGTIKRYAGKEEQLLSALKKKYKIAQPGLKLRAVMSCTVGECMRWCGFQREALEFGQRSLQLFQTAIGDDRAHPDNARPLVLMAWAEGQLGDQSLRIKNATRAIVELKGVEGDKEHHGTHAEALWQMGSAYFALRDYEPALQYLLANLQVEEDIHGAAHVKTTGTLGMVGVAYTKLGQHESSVEYMRRALDIQERELGPLSREVGLSCSNIGWCYHKHGDYIEAAAFYDRAVAAYEAVYGPTHKETMSTRQWLDKTRKQLLMCDDDL